MPISWPKDDATFSSFCLLRFTTLPSQQLQMRRQLDLVDQPTSTKEIFVFCFLAWRGVPGVTHNTFFFDSLLFGGFFPGRFLRKEFFSSFHLYCLPSSLTRSITNTRPQCSFDQAHLSRLEHDGSVSSFSPNQRLTNDGVRGASGSIFYYDGVGSCVLGWECRFFLFLHIPLAAF